MGDSVQALAQIEIFFSKATPERINPDNYVIAAYNAAKLKADLAKVDYYFSKAIDADTTVTNKVDYTRKAADFFKKSGNTAKSCRMVDQSADHQSQTQQG